MSPPPLNSIKTVLLTSLALSAAQSLHAFEPDRTYITGNWQQHGSWSGGGVPGIEDDVLFGGPLTTASGTEGSGNFTVRDTLWTYTTALEIRATGGGALQPRILSFRNFTLASGAGLLTHRNEGSASSLYGNRHFEVRENFIVNAATSFGNRSSSSDINAAVWGVDILGSTIINDGGVIYLNRLRTQSPDEVPDGAWNFGDVEMTGGQFSVISGTTAANGTSSGDNNIVNMRSLSGNGGVITSTKGGTTSTAANVRVFGSANTTFGGQINAGTDENAIISLTRTGSGALTLSNTHSYTGTTLIEESGTLILSGAAAINNSSQIHLTDSGTLIHNSSTALTAPILWEGGTIGGNGVFDMSLTAAGATARTLSPGNSAGTLEITGDLTLDSLTTLQIDLDGDQQGITYDHLIIGGSFEIDSATLALSLGFAPSVSDIFTIVSYDSLVGTFAGLGQGEIITVGSYEFMIDYGADAITLTTAMIPEPGTTALIIAGLALVLVLRRRSRRS